MGCGSVLGETALLAMGGQDGLDPIASVELLELQLLELGLFLIRQPTPRDEAFDFSFESLMLVHETFQFRFLLLAQEVLGEDRIAEFHSASHSRSGTCSRQGREGAGMFRLSFFDRPTGGRARKASSVH